MLAMYVLDGMPLSEAAKALGRKSYKADANILSELGLLAAIDDKLIVQKSATSERGLAVKTKAIINS